MKTSALLVTVLGLGLAAQAETLCASHAAFCLARSAGTRIDLASGTRIAAATETLTYSTGWGGGDSVELAANDATLDGADALEGRGTYDWTPTDGGFYTLTHTIVSNGVPVVLTATFMVPIQVGDDAWAVIVDGVCTITGTSATWAYETAGKSPLYAYTRAITNLVVRDGVTGIGSRFFENMWHLQDVSLAASVTNVGARAFKKCYGLTHVTSLASVPSEVGSYAFSGCHSLETLSFAGDPTFGTQSYTLQAAIYMKDGGIPEVYAMPTITVAGKNEHIMGKKTLNDATWTDVTNFTDDEKKPYHFFKIEMK